MRDLRRHVDGARLTLERVEEFGEALPIPGQALGHRRAGDFLDAFHQIHQRRAMLLLRRREADAAIAEHHGGDAVPRRGREDRVPDRLAVIMRVHIDPARRDQKPGRIDLAPPRPELAADRGDPLAGNRDIAGEARPAGAVDDGPAADDDVVHALLLAISPANDAARTPRPQVYA